MLLYNVVLGLFAAVGAVLFGRWVLSTGSSWILKAVGLILAAGGVMAGIDLVDGGPASDLRILTELLATFGAIVIAGHMLTSKGNKKNPWIQFGIPAFILIFFTIVWWEQINRLRQGKFPIRSEIVLTAPQRLQGEQNPASAPHDGLNREKLCAHHKLPAQYRKQLGCP